MTDHEFHQFVFKGINDIKSQLVRIDDKLEGPSGLMVRMDRVEQQANSFRWHWRISFGALVTVITYLADRFHHP